MVDGRVLRALRVPSLVNVPRGSNHSTPPVTLYENKEGDHSISSNKRGSLPGTIEGAAASGAVTRQTCDLAALRLRDSKSWGDSIPIGLTSH